MGRTSIDIDTPYRHHEFYTPTAAPFGTAGPLLWPTVVAIFLRPIVASADMVYWFCNHGADFQFCFAHTDYGKIEEVIEAQKQTFQTATKTEPTDGETIGRAFRGKRWLAEHKIDDEPFAAKRSQLILAFLHSTSALYLQGLVQEGALWKPEQNNDAEQNPEGSGFESLLHLFCNITRVPTMIQEFEIQHPNGHVHGFETPFALSHIVANSEFPVVAGHKIRVQY